MKLGVFDMILISLSFLMGYLGLIFGSVFGAEIYMYLFGVVGVLSPGYMC